MTPWPRAYPFATILLCLSGLELGRAQQTAQREDFGAGYSSLRPEQKRLVDDWFARFSALLSKPIDPAEGYEKIPLSSKTTFSAVTHALLMTRLTDGSGKSLASSALELVDKVDNVAGEIHGSGGDEQYRVYVQMKPGAQELLNQSKEFKRAGDNTVYHKGYPTSFRSTGGPPSIQISLTRDAVWGDVDVDYRSSKFPVFLLNGHLSASNSDVRAEGNDERHNNQWVGLRNWWRNLLGIPLSETPEVKMEGRVIADEPKVKGGSASDAVYDFLNTWLVEQKPWEAVAYFDRDAYSCMEVESGARADRGMAKFKVLQAMLAANERLGKSASLGEASAGVEITGERVKVIKQAHHPEFVLYDVREDLAEEFKCLNKLESTQISAKAMKSKSFGKYVGAVFKIKRKDREGSTVATLWQHEGDYWKMISYDIDPQVDASSAPNVRAKLPAVAPLDYVSGDKEMVKAASDFLKQWIVKKDIDKALGYIAPECFACVNHYRADDVPAPTTPAEARDLLKKGLGKTADSLGQVKNLEGALVAAEPHHPDLKLVKHGDEKAFAVVSIPEYMGDAAACDGRQAAGDPDFKATPAAGYGKYYATGFSLGSGKTSPAVLWIVWSKGSDSWKARSYVLITP